MVSLADLISGGCERLAGWFDSGCQRLRSCFQRQMSYNDVFNFGEVSDDIRAEMTKVYIVQACLVVFVAFGFQTDHEGKIGALVALGLDLKGKMGYLHRLLCIGSFVLCRFGLSMNEVMIDILSMIPAFLFGFWLEPLKATYESMIMDILQGAFLVFLSYLTASLSVRDRGKMYGIASITCVPQVLSCLGIFPGPFCLSNNSGTMTVYFLGINIFLTLYVLGYSQDMVAQAQGQQANVNYSPDPPLSFYTGIIGIVGHSVYFWGRRFFNFGRDRVHQNVA